MKKDFPAMIYHIQLGQKVVKNMQELQFYEDQGWIKDYQVFQSKNTIEEKIKYHMDELLKLEKEKQKNVVSIDKNVTISSNITKTDETETAKPVKRGRGRPKSGG